MQATKSQSNAPRETAQTLDQERDARWSKTESVIKIYVDRLNRNGPKEFAWSYKRSSQRDTSKAIIIRNGMEFTSRQFGGREFANWAQGFMAGARSQTLATLSPTKEELRKLKELVGSNSAACPVLASVFEKLDAMHL